MNLDAEKLRNYIEDIESRESEKTDLSGQITLIYSDAKADGFDTKAIRQIIKERKMRAEERKILGDVVDAYRVALKMD